MATINPSVERTNDGDYLITWAALTESDTAVAAVLSPAVSGPVVVQVTGDFGTTGGVDLLASNDGLTYTAPINDYGSTTALVALTAAAIFPLLTVARYLRPDVSAGTGVEVDVVVRVPAKR